MVAAAGAVAHHPLLLRLPVVHPSALPLSTCGCQPLTDPTPTLHLHPALDPTHSTPASISSN